MLSLSGLWVFESSSWILSGKSEIINRGLFLTLHGCDRAFIVVRALRTEVIVRMSKEFILIMTGGRGEVATQLRVFRRGERRGTSAVGLRRTFTVFRFNKGRERRKGDYIYEVHAARGTFECIMWFSNVYFFRPLQAFVKEIKLENERNVGDSLGPAEMFKVVLIQLVLRMRRILWANAAAQPFTMELFWNA